MNKQKIFFNPANAQSSLRKNSLRKNVIPLLVFGTQHSRMDQVKFAEDSL